MARREVVVADPHRTRPGRQSLRSLRWRRRQLDLQRLGLGLAYGDPVRSTGGDNDGGDNGLLAAERNRALLALGDESLTGPAISGLTRMEPRPNDESLLYPALHSLEAGWTLQAAWVADSGGNRRRTYHRRRLLPGLRRRGAGG